MEITLTPVATVNNTRLVPADDFWGDVVSEITLAAHIPTAAFDHISDFSHLEVVYYFNQVQPGDMVFAGRPRSNPSYPNMGIFAQRKKDRPNPIGLCTVELIAHHGRTIQVKYLDAINGTPVLDIKPVFKEFQPQSEVKQPAWVADLMQHYW